MSYSTSDWQLKNLNELGYLRRGKSKHRPRNEPSLYGGNYPFIQTGDVKAANLYISEYSQTYSEAGLAQSKLWGPQTLLITIAANIAETAILKINACFPDSIVGFIADPEKADVRFVKYYIDLIKLRMQNISKGTTQDNLSVDKLLSFEFLVPPLHTQRKIAAILSAYDDLIENNNRRIKLLEGAAQDLYREWFLHFRFPGHEAVEMVDSGSDYGMIPRGWGVGLLSDIIHTQYGYTESTQTEPVGPKFLRGTDMNKTSYIDWSQVPYCPIRDKDFGKFKLSFGDILMIRMADPGKVAIVERDDIDAVFASYLVRWKIKHPRLTPYFLFYFLLSDEYQGHISGASTGTTRKSASAKIMTSKQILIPGKGLLERFDDLVMVYRRNLNSLLKKNSLLRETREILLPRLVSGELDVSEIEITGVE